jgi:nucleotide-binding universal stress UspA family protein
MSASALARIVVGVDLLGESEAAIHVALDLAHAFGAAIELVHGVSPPHPLWPDLQPHDVEGARHLVETRLEATAAGARLELDHVPHELVVEPAAHAAELLLRHAEGASLLVLGRHRRRGLLDLGSTARTVLAKADCPVWVQSGPVRVVRRILVPVDLSEESLAALRTACAWATRLEARLVVLHCFQAPELPALDAPVTGPTYVVEKLRDDDKQEFQHAMEAFDFGEVPHETLLAEEDPAQRILDLQDEIDLVMMGTHGRTGLSAAVLGNVAYRVIREGHVPVVALRDPARRWLV